MLRNYAEKVLADWPPLTSEQRASLAELLRPPVRLNGAGDATR
jgi:hypothetical protein